MSDEKPMDELIEEVVDDESKVIEVNGRATKSWEMPAGSSAAAIGEKLLMLTMANPYQILRIFRADDIIFFTAIEGEEWSRV